MSRQIHIKHLLYIKHKIIVRKVGCEELVGGEGCGVERVLPVYLLVLDKQCFDHVWMLMKRSK